ncbi:NADPH-dependent glutamate synthase [Microbacter margulisiae]|uniref:Glutamate synthase (NADPH/NADH) small chain n=1 Tax=Microbacter margulisiae TaxID=1350067 RepID=A0A7W5DMV9_9PORP|nr:NADPH-dependent glutamate synthase [Microbacter margulisiae]MBB3185845.1 glutamate synthase (NADPH/NADH) small chain [Microbacter margulisiae]
MTDNKATSRNTPWREQLRKTISNKERTVITRVHMHELAPDIRNKNNEEVNMGLTLDEALLEAKRCLDCPNPTCTSGCPVNIDIPSFIKNIERNAILEAAAVLKQTSALPAVCGRVCPQEKQCEASCIYTQKLGKAAVAIGYLERFAADYERKSGKASIPECAPLNGIKIAVVGSGPAGLSFAGDMAKRGYKVTVFEALHEIGGVLKYGIPEFRLPNDIIDAEIENIKQMGVEIITNCIVGKTITYDELKKQGYKGLFVGSGAGLPRFMNIPGENLIGVMSSNEYLTRINLMGASRNGDTPVLSGENVAIIGGGNTAMDAVRTAKRLGAKHAMIVYRRSEQEMPARIEEIKHAKEEGVEFLTLHNPIEYMGDEQGRVKTMRLQKMALGEPDASGRRSPVEIPGAIETITVDTVIVSIGVSPNPLVPSSIPGLTVSKWGTLVVSDDLQTSIPAIYAGGDIVRGGATVILAMGDGRKAAAAMDQYLMSNC